MIKSTQHYDQIIPVSMIKPIQSQTNPASMIQILTQYQFVNFDNNIQGVHCIYILDFLWISQVFQTTTKLLFPHNVCVLYIYIFVFMASFPFHP